MSHKIRKGVVLVPLRNAKMMEAKPLSVGDRVVWVEGLPDNKVTVEGFEDLIPKPLYVVEHSSDVRWDDEESKVPWDPFSKLSWERE